MKINYRRYIGALVGLLMFNACGTEFLEVPPRGSDLESEYYQTRDEAFNGLVAVYDVVGYSSGFVTKIGSLNAASDDHYAGGGNSTDINGLQVWSNYTLEPAVGPQGPLWNRGYSGVFRANVLLSKLADVPMDANEKARFEAEAKALRAYFYFDLVRLFENIPLFTAPVGVDEMYDVTQAEPALVWEQIERDLTEALPSLPNILADTERGRFSAGTVHALLGKVYLWQKKYDDAAEHLAMVNGATPGEPNAVYGYDLVDNFADLFKPDNKWNSEGVMVISHTNTSAGVWDCGDCSEGNIHAVMAGPRGFNRIDPSIPNYSSGWSFFTVTQDLVDAMQGDPRYSATILDMNQLVAEGKAEYTAGYMDTGYFLEKYASKMEERWTGAGNWELNFPHVDYEIRLADTYLMEAEALVLGGGDASRAQDLLDAVRARVGLGSVPATFDNIMNERRLELAGEGHRWFDLIRTGRAADALAFKGFQAGKHEVLPIPLRELENTKLQQNKEYGGTL